jgi:hypothetical protein
MRSKETLRPWLDLGRDDFTSRSLHGIENTPLICSQKGTIKSVRSSFTDDERFIDLHVQLMWALWLGTPQVPDLIS